MTAPDVRTAAQSEAEQRWRRDAGEPWRRVFVKGAVWGAALVTPTREQIAEALKTSGLKWGGPSLKEFKNDPPTRKHYAQADAVLALMAGLAEGER